MSTPHAVDFISHSLDFLNHKELVKVAIVNKEVKKQSSADHLWKRHLELLGGSTLQSAPLFFQVLFGHNYSDSVLGEQKSSWHDQEKEYLAKITSRAILPPVAEGSPTTCEDCGKTTQVFSCDDCQGLFCHNTCFDCPRRVDSAGCTAECNKRRGYPQLCLVCAESASKGCDDCPDMHGLTCDLCDGVFKTAEEFRNHFGTRAHMASILTKRSALLRRFGETTATGTVPEWAIDPRLDGKAYEALSARSKFLEVLKYRGTMLQYIHDSAYEGLASDPAVQANFEKLVGWWDAAADRQTTLDGEPLVPDGQRADIDAIVEGCVEFMQDEFRTFGVTTSSYVTEAVFWCSWKGAMFGGSSGANQLWDTVAAILGVEVFW